MIWRRSGSSFLRTGSGRFSRGWGYCRICRSLRAISTWMQTTAQLWLVYKLTGSAALLGVFGFASQVPMLFLSSIGGYVGDRYDRHRGVIATQTISMILAFALAGLTLTKLINEWELIV